jgi:TRAP-type C4-dicarboxylate transport system substrate-binding protein
VVSARKMTGALAMCAVAALSLSACGGLNASKASAGGGKGIEPGATKAEYIAAFADVEPLTLDFQFSSTTTTSYSAQRDVEWAESIEEWSGGKITINKHASGAIAKPTDVPDALIDGRLDIAHYYTTYEPQKMAAFVDMSDSMVQNPSSPLIGELVSDAVMLDVGFNTPEIMANFEDRGLHVIVPANPNGNTSAMCKTDKQSPADWKGAQIRGNASAHEVQVQALGGVLTSVELAEVYEAVERGVLDCSLQSTATANSMGWLDIAPFLKIPREASFAPGAGSLVAGSSWETLPLLVQQLMFDRLANYLSAEHFNAITSVKIAAEKAKEGGGGLEFLDNDSEAALAKANDELLTQVEASKNLDGKALNQAVAASITKWTDIAKDLGYEETGDVTDFAQWYEGSDEFKKRDYLQPFADRIYQEVVVPHRPK